MPAILPSVKIDSDSMLSEYFMTQQVAWILGEDELHAQKKQVFAIGEKSVRVGWTYGDPFKNVRKRLRFPKRDYLLTTKDYPSAIEYMRLAHEFTDLFKFTRAIVSHGEDFLKVNRIGPDGRPTSFQEEIKISYVKFDNGSRIIAFSAHPQAMAVYGGDVGLDEFARHPNAELLWQTAQGRVTWGFDMAVWSSHEGDDTLFNQFAQQARASLASLSAYGADGQGEVASSSSSSSVQNIPGLAGPSRPSSPCPITEHATRNTPAPTSENRNSKIKNPSSP